MSREASPVPFEPSSVLPPSGLPDVLSLAFEFSPFSLDETGRSPAFSTRDSWSFPFSPLGWRFLFPPDLKHPKRPPPPLSLSLSFFLVWPRFSFPFPESSPLPLPSPVESDSPSLCSSFPSVLPESEEPRFERFSPFSKRSCRSSLPVPC